MTQPRHEPSAPFDYDTVFEDLDGPANTDPMSLAIEGFARLLKLLLPKGRPLPRAVGLRAIAMLWTLNPGAFPGAPSARRLARRCGVSPNHFARLTAQASQTIGWQNRAQIRAKPAGHKKSFSAPTPTRGDSSPPTKHATGP